MIQKTDLRAHWKNLRKNLPQTRRKEAASDLLAYGRQSLNSGSVLSFASFGSEIDTSELNQWLASFGALLLPRVEKEEIAIYRVENIKRDLVPSLRGPLEPNPDRCEQVPCHTIQTALVPGLCFDESLYRLGYGKGHYDRFLPKLNCPCIGVGFREQKATPLPRDNWDVPLHTAIYF